MRSPAADCGSCSACCFLMAIPTFNKPACVYCEHVERPHGGCRVYDQPLKPQECSDFKCLWLASQTRRLDDRMGYELRPDRSKVMFHDALAVFPIDYEVPQAEENVMYVHVFPDYPGAWLNPAPKAHIDLVLSRGCSVHVIIGHRRIVLNPGQPATSREDGAATRTALRQLA